MVTARQRAVLLREKERELVAALVEIRREQPTRVETPQRERVAARLVAARVGDPTG